MKFEKEKNRIFLCDSTGTITAEVTFPEGENHILVIDRTFVEEALRGQGVASKLLKAAADEIRAQGKKARPVCSYAAAWFQKHPEEQDLLASV